MKRYHDKGTAIILVLISLTMLSTTAVIFVKISHNERFAANNYIAKTYARLATFAGIDHAVGAISEKLKQGEVVASPVLYPSNSSSLQQAVFLGKSISLDRGIIQDTFSHSGLVGVPFDDKVIGTYDVNGNFYALKITNESGKLNVNSHITLDTDKQEISNAVLEKLLSNLAQRCGIKNSTAIAQKIVTRPLQNNMRFSSFIALESLVLGFEENSDNLQLFLKNLSAHSVTENVFAVHREAPRQIHEVPIYYKEKRSAIDINSASEVLLQTVVENIRATAMFYPVKINADALDSFGKKAETFIEDKPRFFSLDFSISQVEEIVIAMQQRIKFIGSFRSYKQFALFIDRNVVARHFPPAPDGIASQKWVKAWQGALKSNFNSNVTTNFWNPNEPIYRRVSKGDLFHISSGQTFPGHTTEFVFFGLGPFKITSIGYIIAKKQIVAQHRLSVQAHLGEILHHTTQNDFHGEKGEFRNATSIPNNISQWGKENSDAIIGGVEPKALPAENGLFSSGQTFVDNQFDKETFAIPTNFSYFGGEFNNDNTVRAKTSKLNPQKLMKIAPIQHQSNVSKLSENNLSHDGIVSRRAFYQSKESARYFVTHSLSKESTKQNFRGKNILKNSHIGNYQGSIEFWVKLDEDPGNDSNPGLTFGLMSATTKNKRQQGTINPLQEQQELYTKQNDLNKGAFHEGTQTYLFINSFGKMHFSRLYYAYAFTLDPEGVRHYGITNTRDLDNNRSAIRHDLEVNVANLQWKAHEWHHVIMRWDDIRGRLELELDGRNTDSGLAFTTTNGIGILNEIDPRDSLFINGYTRNEAQPGGYFAFDRRIEYPGNATIDAFASFDSENTAQYRTRYSLDCEYKNVFTISPKRIIGPLFWVAYDNSEKNQAAGTIKSQVNVSIDGFVTDITDQIAIPNNTSLRESILNYNVSFVLGRKANNAIECPTLDSVSLVLFFHYPQLLLENR